MDVMIESRFGLADALEIKKDDMVSIVGAGGKTTALYGLAGELRHRGLTVITTTTTHMQTPRHGTTMPPLVYTTDDQNWYETVRARIDRYGSATVLGMRLRDDKLKGLEPVQIESLRGFADCIVVEGDGARGGSLKVPAPHEPVIPHTTNVTVVVAGLDALGMPLDDAIVHRLDNVVQATGTVRGAPISEETIALALTKGYSAKVPAASRWVCLLNKVGDSLLGPAEETARILISQGAPEVIFGEASRPSDCFYRVTEKPTAAGGAFGAAG